MAVNRFPCKPVNYSNSVALSGKSAGCGVILRRIVIAEITRHWPIRETFTSRSRSARKHADRR